MRQEIKRMSQWWNYKMKWLFEFYVVFIVRFNSLPAFFLNFYGHLASMGEAEYSDANETFTDINGTISNAGKYKAKVNSVLRKIPCDSNVS